jgi:hypothetical protein
LLFATGLGAASDDDAPPLPIRVFLRESPCASNSVARTDDERREVAPPLVAAATAAIPVVAPMDDDEAACGDRALELALAACVWRSGERGDAKALAMAAEGSGGVR